MTTPSDADWVKTIGTRSRSMIGATAADCWPCTGPSTTLTSGSAIALVISADARSISPALSISSRTSRTPSPRYSCSLISATASSAPRAAPTPAYATGPVRSRTPTILISSAIPPPELCVELLASAPQAASATRAERVTRAPAFRRAAVQLMCDSVSVVKLMCDSVSVVKGWTGGSDAERGLPEERADQRGVGLGGLRRAGPHHLAALHEHDV